MLASFALPRFDLPQAVGALARLLRDPDDLPQVFTLIEAISGTAPHRLLWGFKLSASGKQLLRDRPDIGALLCDRERLRALPEGSVGRAYLAFIESEGISPEGIREASMHKDKIEGRPEVFQYLHMRMRDTHDLWHTVTGYQGDVLGELSLLSFGLGQHWNTGIAMIVVAGILKSFDGGETSVIFDGYRRGRAAKWLPALDWESVLARPLAEVREELKLGAPAKYTPIRTSELRAEGRIAASAA